MKERRIVTFLIIFSIVSIPIFYSISDNSGLLQGKLMNSGIENIYKKPPKVVYDLNVPLKNHMITRMKTYEAKAIEISKETVELYAKNLNMNNNIQETDSQFK